MNISLESASSLVESKDDGGNLLDTSSRRRLSIPEAFTKSSSPPDWVPTKVSPPEKSPSREHPYEFEKVRESVNHPHDTLEDRAARDAFRPKRQYMSHQRPKRRSPLDDKAVRRGSLTQQLKQARKSFHSSMPNLDLQSSLNNDEDDTHLSAFERKRKKQQMEEGALYAATRATERATRSWKRKTIVLGPLGLIPDENEKDDEQDQKRALLALLEKDANKHNASLSSIHGEHELDTGSNNNDVEGDSPDTTTAVDETASTPVKDNRTVDNNSNNNSDKASFMISPQAVKEQKLRQVFQKQNSMSNNNKSAQEEEEANPMEASASDEQAETNSKESSRQEQLRLLKVALKKAAKSKEPALMSLVLLENAKQMKTTKKSKRSSMPDMMSASDKLNSSSPKATNGGKKKKKRLSDPSSMDEAARVAAMDSSSKSASSPPKKDRRSYMLRRMSAPDFSSTVAALTRHGSSPEEALKEMSAMPKHMLADIITAPENARDSSTTNKEEPVPDATTTNGKKKTTKKKKGSRRSTMSSSMSQLEGQLSSNRRNNNDEADATAIPNGALSNKSNDKTTKKRRSRRSVMKEGRRRSMPDLTKMEKEDEDVYDWALAAKQKENNNGGEWKHIKSNANAVRRPQDETIQPLKVNNEIASNSDSLPKLEALLPLVEPQN